MNLVLLGDSRAIGLILDSNLRGGGSYEYYGFDTFEGLPNAWRHFEAGSFDASGSAPYGLSANVHFLKGFVEDTLPLFVAGQLSRREENEPTFFLFDLDLLGPTIFCFELVEKYLQKNDLLYFDEAFDEGERSIIEKQIQGHANYEVIGASIQSLLVRYIRN